MVLLLDKLKAFFINQGFDRTYWIGYSGGLDSQVLLHLLVELRKTHPLILRAVYINHGLSPNAGLWAQQCASQCQQWQVDFSEHQLSLDLSTDDSPEAIAREHRYGVFANLMQNHDCLLTAHHQNDQAETVLMQLLRGAGPKGLAAMPFIKKFAKGFHARPLLNFTREELSAYASETQLTWIEDESNANKDFVRNFLRHDILPVLQKRWPSVTKTLARTAENCAEAQLLLDEMAQQDLGNVKGFAADTLSIQKLKNLNSARQRNVLRAWLEKQDFAIPSLIKIQQIQKDILQSASDKTPLITWAGVELRRFRDDLFAMKPLEDHDSSQILEWDFLEPIPLPHGMTLKATMSQGAGLNPHVKNVTIRFRQNAETLQLPGRKCRHSLKKLFQEWGVPVWLRDRIPLIYVEDKLAAVVGYGVSVEFMVGSRGYDIYCIDPGFS